MALLRRAGQSAAGVLVSLSKHTLYIRFRLSLCQRNYVQVRLVHRIIAVPEPSHSGRDREVRGEQVAEVRELPQVRRAFEDDARFKKNNTTILMRPKQAAEVRELPQVRRATADDARFKKSDTTILMRPNGHQRHYGRFFEDREFGDRAVPRQGENGRSPQRARPHRRGAGGCAGRAARPAQGHRGCRSGWCARKTHATILRIFSCVLVISCFSLSVLSLFWYFGAGTRSISVRSLARVSPVLPQQTIFLFIVVSVYMFALDVSSFSVSRGPAAGSLHASTSWPSASFELRTPRSFCSG